MFGQSTAGASESNGSNAQETEVKDADYVFENSIYMLLFKGNQGTFRNLIVTSLTLNDLIKGRKKLLLEISSRPFEPFGLFAVFISSSIGGRD